MGSKALFNPVFSNIANRFFIFCWGYPNLALYCIQYIEASELPNYVSILSTLLSRYLDVNMSILDLILGVDVAPGERNDFHWLFNLRSANGIVSLFRTSSSCVRSFDKVLGTLLLQYAAALEQEDILHMQRRKSQTASKVNIKMCVSCRINSHGPQM